MEKISIELKNALQEDVGKLMRYREALRHDDRQVLDKLITLAKGHATACANANKMKLMESMLLAIVIEQQKIIERLNVSGSNDVAHQKGGNYFCAPTLQILPEAV